MSCSANSHIKKLFALFASIELTRIYCLTLFKFRTVNHIKYDYVTLRALKGMYRTDFNPILKR